MLKFLREQLKVLLEQRKALAAERDQIIADAEKRGELTEADETAFAEKRAAIATLDTDIEARQARIAELEEDDKREQRAADAYAAAGATGEQRERPAGGAQVTDPPVYRQGGQESYFRDLVRANIRQSPDSFDRLRRNDRQMADSVEYRALTTTDGAGGEMVPPLWMVQQFIELARAGRVFADQINQQPLPAGTDSINLPRLATGTAVAEQATQNTAVQNTDATTNSISASVATIAGQQVVSVQLLEQSPVNMDAILLQDLAADYAIKADVFALNNNAAGKLGVLNVSGINPVTYTDASPTVGEAYAKVADAIQQIHTGRLMPADKIFMHPRRWAWYLSALDTAGRPLVTPDSQNSIAQSGGVVSEGRVGVLQGLPVFVDPNIPTNLGAGTNEDRIIVVRSGDVILYEGTPRAEAFREPLAAQLSVLLRFYNYIAIHGSRYPKSISVISGTGLITPTF